MPSKPPEVAQCYHGRAPQWCAIRLLAYAFSSADLGATNPIKSFSLGILKTFTPNFSPRRGLYSSCSPRCVASASMFYRVSPMLLRMGSSMVRPRLLSVSASLILIGRPSASSTRPHGAPQVHQCLGELAQCRRNRVAEWCVTIGIPFSCC